MIPSRHLLVLVFLVALLPLSGCASKEGGYISTRGVIAPSAGGSETPSSLDDYDTSLQSTSDSLDDYGYESTGSVSYSLDDYDDGYDTVRYYDPFEPWNRMWFGFNDVLLLKVIKPVHKGYVAVTPARLRSGLSNFAYNLKFPIRFVNSILQGKFTQAGVEFGRFFANTVTSLGFADVSKTLTPLYPSSPETATFGHTLAQWGIPAGPYLVWPVLGPTTARGTLGMAGDVFMTPQTYVTSIPVTAGTSGALTFNGMGNTISAYESLKRVSLEPYSALRSGYYSLGNP